MGSTHSPLPWNVVIVDEEPVIHHMVTPETSDGSWCVTCTDSGLTEPDAEFIVRCVNNHDGLVKALKEMREASAAMMRVIAWAESDLTGALANELSSVGIEPGFGARAEAALAKLEANIS